MDRQEKILTEGTEAPDVVPAPPVEHELPELLEELPPAPDALVEDVAADAPPAEAPSAPFSSLYDTEVGTGVAIAFGMAILVVVQIKVARIFGSAKSIIEALTYFATSMVAILVGIYVCDLLIAGPETSLLREGERSSIVNFVKDTCLMVFAYFFGTKSATSSPSPQPPSE